MRYVPFLESGPDLPCRETKPRTLADVFFSIPVGWRNS
jgi:hypothetical protein